jgi:4a-hydroxytetrahydrobiopterin dehydratase
VRTFAELREARCRPQRAGALPEAAIREQLQALPDWRFEGGALVRTYRFADYHRTIAFVNALAWIAHGEDHHPDLAVAYDRCEVRFSTHSVGGVSDNDFICAAKTEALYAQGAPAPAA